MKYGTYETYKIANADFTGLKVCVVTCFYEQNCRKLRMQENEGANLRPME
jgi:hypothetical protein